MKTSTLAQKDPLAHRGADVPSAVTSAPPRARARAVVTTRVGAVAALMGSIVVTLLKVHIGAASVIFSVMGAVILFIVFIRVAAREGAGMFKELSNLVDEFRRFRARLHPDEVSRGKAPTSARDGRRVQR